MSKPKTLEELISSIRLRAGINSDSSSGTGMKDADLILFINEEMDELITHVQQSKQEYMTVISKITPIASQSEYRLDARALYQQLKEVYYINPTNVSRQRLTYIDNSAIPLTITTSDTPMFYLLRGSDLVLYPQMGGTPSGYYEAWWSFKPNTLVKSTECRQITGISVLTKTVTFGSNIPSTWTSNNKFDAHSKYSGAEIKQWDLTPLTVAGNQIVFSDTIDTTILGRKTLEIGDWICLEQEAALPALPTELHPVLSQMVVVRLAESRGDSEGQQLHQSKLDRMLEVATVGMKHRVDSEKKIVNRDSVWDYLSGSY